MLYNDQFDRFSAPIEKRYDADEVRRLLERAGLQDVQRPAVLRLGRRRHQSPHDNRANRRPVKIVRIIARLNLGGPARHVVLLDRGLRDRGHETLLVHGSLDAGEGSFEPLAAELGVPTRKLPELGRRVRPLDDAKALVRLIGILFREQPDVVHTHTAKAGALGRVAACVFNATRGRARRCLVVHTFHGHVFEGYFSPRVNRLVRGVERLLAGVTDRIITISPAQRADIVERFRIADAARTVVVPLGLDLAPLLESGARPLREELGIGADALVFGYVGRLVPIKDLPTLVRAFARARQQVPTAHLLIVGDGPARAEMEPLVETLGIGASVHLAGWRDDLTRVYATIDVAVLSSRNEGTPVALIEAMAAGRPVVATAVGGVADVVQDGETGWLVPPGDVDAMAAAMVRLAGDAAARARMGALGRERVRARYFYDRLVDDIQALYVQALDERRGVQARP